MNPIILKYVLKNAYDFEGKVNSKVVLGLVLKEDVALRSQVPIVLKQIEEATASIQKLTHEELLRKLVSVAPQLLAVKKEEVSEGPLKVLLGAQKGKFVVRIAPSPSGPLHIGHAYGTSLNYEYAKMYEGKLLLRIEDTNPENIYPQAYDLIERDAQWLTEQGVAEVFVQSSRLGMYYDHMEKLVDMGKAYVCTCDAESWKALKNKGEACACRALTIKENSTRWAKMFGEFAEGEAVIRLKTDIAHKNPAMRDFAIMRINEHVHPKTGKEQRLWPLMVYSVAIDDHEMGVTHVLNGKDHADNAAKEKLIMDCFDWKTPEYKHWGMINFEGFTLSTSQTRRAIEQGAYSSWEDIRLPFLPALRRRGYQPGAFRRFAVEIGLSLNDKTVTLEEFWKNINAFNRELVEPLANRYFFVEDPVHIRVPGAQVREAKLDVHPSYPQRGKRTIVLGEDVYINRKDLDRLEEGKIHRLIDGYNFTVEQGRFKFHSDAYEEYKNSTIRGNIIHYLPFSGSMLRVEVLLESGEWIHGFGEDVMKKLKVGDIVQLERCFFARLDAKEEGRLLFWYLHK